MKNNLEIVSDYFKNSNELINENNINIDISDYNNLMQKQTDFFKDDLLGAINNGVDIGIKEIFPNGLSDNIIYLKNQIMDFKIEDGIYKSLLDAFKKNEEGLNFKGDSFKNIEEAEEKIMSSGIVDNVSIALNENIEDLSKKDKIENNISSTLEKEKGTIIKNVKESINKTFEKQKDSLVKLDKYIERWKEQYKKQDISGMEKAYNKMDKIVDSLMPIEQIIDEYKTIESLQTLIKNKENCFDLSEQEKEVVNKLLNV